MKITFEKVTTIPAAVALKLTPEQAASRLHALELFGDFQDVFVGTQALIFKAGETVEIVGDLPKGILPIYDQLKPAEVTLESPPEIVESIDVKKTSHKKHKQAEGENDG